MADIDECVNPPCGLGSCTNTDGSYKCTCPAGLTGTYCEQGKLSLTHVLMDYKVKKITSFFLVYAIFILHNNKSSNITNSASRENNLKFINE